jgi:DNA-directed RNA polymerase specialized sigma24 family protein
MTDHDEVAKEVFSVKELRKGSPQAFRIFFIKQYSAFYSFAGLLLADKRSAKNVAAAAFFLLWAKHADFGDEKNIKAFLYITIRDNCLRYLRHLNANPDAGSYAPETRFIKSLPDEILQELLEYTKRFGPF